MTKKMRVCALFGLLTSSNYGMGCGSQIESSGEDDESSEGATSEADGDDSTDSTDLETSGTGTGESSADSTSDDGSDDATNEESGSDASDSDDPSDSTEVPSDESTSTDTTTDPDSSDDTSTSDGEYPACNVNIAEISGYTQTKVTLAKGNEAIDAANVKERGLGYVVVGRDALFRVFVETGGVNEDIQATLTLTSAGKSESWQATMQPKGNSVDAKLDSTFNFEVPGTAIAADTTYSVNLTQQSPCDDPGNTRFPESGEVELEAKNAGKLRVSILRTQTNDLPAAVFDDQRRAMLEADLKTHYPEMEIEIQLLPEVAKWTFPTVTLGDQVDSWNECGNYFSDSSLFPYERHFLICLYRQQEDFPRGVSGGMAYLKEEDELTDADMGTDAMAIIGYPTEMVPADGSYPEWMRTTYIHELGHTLGAPHAPNGGAGEPDPNFPYSDGSIGRWGWNPTLEVLRDPKAPDLMGYDWFNGVEAVWLSDYNYGKFVRRIERVETHMPAPLSGAVQVYRSVIVVDGQAPRLATSTMRSARTPAGRRINLNAKSGRKLLPTPIQGIVQRSSDERVRRILVPVVAGVSAVIVDGAEVSF
jgi:hypothetical protein